MLILTRRTGENIVVGDDVVISVMEIRGDAVRLGIQAPRSVTVHREEVYLELQRVNRQAAASGTRAADETIAQELGKLHAPRRRDADPRSPAPAADGPAAPGQPPNPVPPRARSGQ